jgi:queuine tRNA-ribosyltransferase
VCATHSRAYLHHLTKTQEPLGWTLVGQHNIHFYHQLMREIRQSILEDRFMPLYRERREILQIEDIDHPVTHPKRTSVKVEHVGDYDLHGEPPAIRQISSGRVIGTTSQLDAAVESQIVQHLRLPAESPPLIVWDTQLTTAATALAVILLYEAEAAKGPIRPLHLVSFSDDLAPLRLALHHKRHFPYLRHGAADTLIRRDVWESRYCLGLKWSLVHGSPAAETQSPAADIFLQGPQEL